MTARLDHLVIVAATLERRHRVVRSHNGHHPGPGGEHPLMGTHNCLFRVGHGGLPACLRRSHCHQPRIAHPHARTHGRWFDMDDPALQARIAKDGPRLVHFVVNVPNAAQALAAWAALGLDRGRRWRRRA